MDFLVIDDDRTFCEATCLLIEGEGHYVESASTPELALEALRTGKFDATLLDLHLGRHSGLELLPEIIKLRPDMPVVMFSAEGTVKAAVQAMHHGAMDFLEKPFTREQFHLVFARIQRFAEMSHKIEQLEEGIKEAQSDSPDAFIDFETPSMKALADVLRRAAKSPSAVLLVGESGTGKSAAARVVHVNSDFADKPFVTISCPSLSRELLESHLFGHVRGAFVGALKDHWGRIKVAEGGTLFLDEIGDLPLEIQARLLRLLQEQEYERIGETVTRRASVRIVAATNRDLKKRVAAGTFREDLFYRLNAITIELPALREHPENIPEFAEYFLRQCALRADRPITGFTPECLEFLRAYQWPGNLRELHNTIERSVLLCHGPQIGAADLPVEIRQPKLVSEPTGVYPAIGSMVSLARIEELHIRHLLANCSNLSEAAHVLGIDQATLYRKRKRMGISGRVFLAKIAKASATA
jgi:NtrC-family two-component system response regulator AlgB